MKVRSKNSFLQWQGQRIRVTETGSGTPLLLIAGLGCSSDAWAPFVAELSHRHVIRFDSPGTGDSDTPLYPVAIRSLANLASTVIDHCGVARADVVGFSYGGAIAQELAYRYPASVDRLVLAATTCGLGGVPCAPGVMAAIATPWRFYSAAYFERMAPQLYGGNTARDPGVRARDIAARRARPPSPYGYAMQLLAAGGWTSLTFLERIRHDTLVIMGDDDPLVPIANARILAHHIPRARLEIVPGAGHLFLWDDAAVTAPRIAEFLDDTPRRRGRVGTQRSAAEPAHAN